MYNYSVISNIDKIKAYIKKEIINGSFDILLLKIIEKNMKDFIIKKGNVIFQFTSFYNQKYNIYNNISYIDFRECENVLRNYYNSNNSFFLFKVDYFIEGFLIILASLFIIYEASKKIILSNCSKP